MKSNEAKYELQKARRDELAEQIDKCTIRAERPGLVVYAGSDDPWRRRGDPHSIAGHYGIPSDDRGGRRSNPGRRGRFGDIER